MTYIRTGRSGRSIIQGCQSVNNWTNNHYINIAGESVAVASTANCIGIMPIAGTFRNLYVELENAPGGSDTVTVTLYVSGASTSLTVSITASATTGSDTTNTVTVAAGEDVCYRLTRTGTVTDGALFYGVEFNALR